MVDDDPETGDFFWTGVKGEEWELKPSQPREAQRYLDALIHDQNSESNWSWGLAAAATGKSLASNLYFNFS